MIDAHCHLMDIEGINIDDYRGLERIANCGYDLKSSENALLMKKAHSDFLYCIVGASPQKCMSAKSKDEVEEIERLAIENKDDVDAIGEIGLDFHWADTSEKMELQRGLFRRQIMLAEEMGRPIVIHARDAVKECIHELKNFGGNVQFHFFSGSVDEAREIADRGWYISIPPLRGKERVKTIASVDISHITAETDAPAVGKTPLDVRRAIEIIAETKGVSFEEADRATSENAKRIFG